MRARRTTNGVALCLAASCAPAGDVQLCHQADEPALTWVAADDVEALLEDSDTWLPAEACETAENRQASTITKKSKTISMSGTAFVADASLFPLPYATVTIAEVDDALAITDLDGSWTIEDLPAGKSLTPQITFPNEVYAVLGLPPFQTMSLKTFKSKSDVDLVFFQSVPQYVLEDFSALLGITLDDDACQIVTVVAEAGMADLASFDEYYFPHGVEGATVSLSPKRDVDAPIYFDESVIPDPDLTETTIDGGVLWTNVPGGKTYKAKVKSSDADASFESIKVECEPGGFVNASPPHGLIEIDDDDDSDSDSDSDSDR